MSVEWNHNVVDGWELPNGNRVEITKAVKVVLGSIIDQHFTWSTVARNGQTVAGGGETFTRKSSAKRAALRNQPPVEDFQP